MLILFDVQNHYHRAGGDFAEIVALIMNEPTIPANASKDQSPPWEPLCADWVFSGIRQSERHFSSNDLECALNLTGRIFCGDQHFEIAIKNVKLLFGGKLRHMNANKPVLDHVFRCHDVSRFKPEQPASRYRVLPVVILRHSRHKISPRAAQSLKVVAHDQERGHGAHNQNVQTCPSLTHSCPFHPKGQGAHCRGAPFKLESNELYSLVEPSPTAHSGHVVADPELTLRPKSNKRAMG